MERKAALVTASSSEIGRAIALMLAAKGYDVGAQYLSNHTVARELKEQAEKNGVQVKLLPYDLMKEAGARSIVEQTVEAFGRLDVLVNTIGPCVYQDLPAVTPADWKQMIDINLNSVFNVIYHARDHVVRTRGHVVTFGYAGVDLLKARGSATAYCAAKAGLVILTRTLAAELGRFGVRVNAVCPGWIDDTPHPEARKREIVEAIPFGRMGEVGEVADVVAWLVDGSPEYVTGALIPVAGGSEY